MVEGMFREWEKHPGTVSGIGPVRPRVSETRSRQTGDKRCERKALRPPGIDWDTPAGSPSGSVCVPVCEILAVREADVEGRGKTSGRWQRLSRRPAEGYPYAFTVSYVERVKQHRWRCRDVTFQCADGAVCQQWIHSIRDQLSKLTGRPRHLLVYINPHGGRGRGKQIYEEKVAPLFSRASISASVIVTERANHARDHLKTDADLKKYDGVVCVGGDGMFSEVLHGLVSRTQRDAGVDQNRREQRLVPCPVRIGIIPAGSTDCVCYGTVGVNDPVTSALHIIVGDSQPLDVCSIRHADALLRYSVSLLGYGFYGDVLTDSERRRWMGPVRYDVSGLKTFLAHNYYEGTVSFLPATDVAGSPRDKTTCRAGCSRCLKDSQAYGTGNCVRGRDQGGDWRVIRGKFLAVNAAGMSCACPRSPGGLSPSAHLADGTTDLILVRKCSRASFLRHLLRHTSPQDQFDLSFVEVHRVRRFCFMPRRSEHEGDPVCSSWNCDGEILPHASVDVGVHCQLIRLFARGIEDIATP
ncbi:hypothetical protein COCON_G00231060 [Conger conger]|uniref:DAGKc domain-containing protein n=1 Tax=Conger conger TaxID=82655 RepID=A0A9Q1CUQ0_CONCO|nr:hypothetical protein COCON_G00231060 [Conger conger]